MGLARLRNSSMEKRFYTLVFAHGASGRVRKLPLPGYAVHLILLDLSPHVFTPSLVIQPGGVLEGRSHMRGEIKLAEPELAQPVAALASEEVGG